MVIENSGYATQELAEKAMKAQLEELTAIKITSSNTWYKEGYQWGYTILV